MLKADILRDGYVAMCLDYDNKGGDMLVGVG